MRYSAKIKWIYTREILDVIITTSPFFDDDDYESDIFFSFQDREEIEQYVQDDAGEFKIIEYKQLN